MPAVLWVFGNHQQLKSYSIFDFFDNIPLFISFFFLVWGFHRLIKIMKSADHLVNSSMVILHITAYSFILIASIVENFTIKTLHSYEVSTYCDLVINLTCTAILALIVNEICQKAFLNKTPYAFAFAGSQTDARTLRLRVNNSNASLPEASREMCLSQFDEAMLELVFKIPAGPPVGPDLDFIEVRMDNLDFMDV